MKKKTLFFCYSNVRPLGCSKETNLCCLFCDERDACVERGIHNHSKVIPCNENDFEEEEDCEFQA